jgi:hypothetical protein
MHNYFKSKDRHKMQKKHILYTFAAWSFIFLATEKGFSTEGINHTHCDVIGDFCHHRISGLACLKHHKGMSQENLKRFIDQHLGTDIIKLNLSKQKNVTDEILKQLAESKRASAIQSLDLMSTSAGYSGIVALWNSSTFGSLVRGSPIYEIHTGKPVSVIKIEVGHTRVIKQYEEKKFAYPLPLHKDFEIIYGHKGIGNKWKITGYKQIKLFDHGEELETQQKSK